MVSVLPALLIQLQRMRQLRAMSALGYSPAEALKAVKQIEIAPDMDAGAIP